MTGSVSQVSRKSRVASRSFSRMPRKTSARVMADSPIRPLPARAITISTTDGPASEMPDQDIRVQERSAMIRICRNLADIPGLPGLSN